MNIKLPSVLRDKAAQFGAAAPALGVLTVMAGGVLVSAIQFRWQVLAASVGVALTAALGPGIVSGMVTATI